MVGIYKDLRVCEITEIFLHDETSSTYVFSHIRCTPFISCAEWGLQKIVEHEANEKQWTWLFLTQELAAHVVQVLQSNKTLKGRVNLALAA